MDQQNDVRDNNDDDDDDFEPAMANNDDDDYEGYDDDDEDPNGSLVAFNNDSLAKIQMSHFFGTLITPFAISGLSINPADFWITGAGPLIGRSILLRLRVILNSANRCLDELFASLAYNKFIGFLDLRIQQDGYDDVFDLLRPFLRDNSSLRVLCVSTNIDRPPGLNSLASALGECNVLERIAIGWNQAAEDEEVAAFFDSLTNKPMHAIAINKNPLEQKGCKALANLLSIPSSQIDELDIRHCAIDEESIDILCDALIKNSTMERLDLIDIGHITMSGCISVSKVLCHPRSLLETLLLCNNEINDEGMLYLGEGVASNKTLKYLDLSNHQSISLAGWQVFLNCLKNPGSAPALEDLLLHNCNLDDEKATAIFSVLALNNSLKTLEMDDNSRMTVRGLYAFFHSLLGSRSTIQELFLPDEIEFDEVNDEEFDKEFGILSRALCAATSIDSTYLSNHSFIRCQLFEKLGDGDIGSVWEKIQTLLAMNMAQNKTGVAREKILKYHFSTGNSGFNTLAGMPEAVLPYAMDWFGRDNDGFSPMFDFVRSFPALFDIPRVQSAGSKRMKVCVKDA